MAHLIDPHAYASPSVHSSVFSGDAAHEELYYRTSGLGVSDQASTVSAAPSGYSSNMLDDPRLRDIMLSDLGLETLLTRLKQSIQAIHNFAAFIKRMAAIDSEGQTNFKKLTKQVKVDIAKPDTRQGTFAAQLKEIIAVHEAMADAQTAFVAGLHTLHEELVELAKKHEKTRKHMRDMSMRHEKTLLDAEVAAEKARALYLKHCEDMERLRDPSKSKFRLKNASKTALQEQELQIKITSAESEFRQKVLTAQQLRTEIENTLRPGYTRDIQAAILACDESASAQLLKYTRLNENLHANTSLIATPQSPQDPAMTDLAAKINSPMDLYNDILAAGQAANPKKPLNRHPVLFVQHPYMSGATATSSTLTLADTPSMLSPGYSASLNSVNVSRSPSPVRSSRSTVAGSLYEADLPKSKVYDFGATPSLAPSSASSYMSSASAARQNGYVLPAFGTPLDTLIEYEALPDPLPLPRVVRECVAAIDQFGLDMEGIYRHTGPTAQIQVLKHLFDTASAEGHGPDLSQPERYGITDIHAVSGTLKLFFVELPDPLLGRGLHGEFLAAARIENAYRRRDAVHALVNHLPDNSYTCLRHLAFHLDRVARREALNRMGLVNLGNMWGNVLMAGSDDLSEMALCARVVECIIENCEQMFEAQ